MRFYPLTQKLRTLQSASLRTMLNMSAQTYKGNPSYATIGKPHLDYFGGVTRQSHLTHVEKLALECYQSDPKLALACFFQKRDCRGGAGERLPFYHSMKVLPPEVRRKFYRMIPHYGYWNDLNSLAELIPEDRKFIAGLWADALLKNLIGFEHGVISRGVEKWLPTEGGHDDTKWQAVDAIIEALNALLSDPIELRNPVQKTVLAQFQKQVGKDCKVVWTGSTLNADLTDTIVCQRTAWILNLTEKLPLTVKKFNKRNYRKWCSFMRAYSEVLEHYTSTQHWDWVDYAKVPSIAFDRTKKQFMQHTPDRFKVFIESVKQGDAKINVSRLAPYQLVAQESSEVADQQWNLVVEETERFYQGVPSDCIFRPENSIHVADVSGSMTSLTSGVRPIDVALSMAVLSAEVGRRPLYTFSGQPKRFEPTWERLSEAKKTIIDHNYNTNFKGLLDRIAVDTKDAPPKCIYVYTDGGFDQMCQENPISAADYIEKLWPEDRPVVIFWNVAGNVTDFATTTEHSGIVQLSGFSKDLYRTMTRLSSLGELNPESFFRSAVLCDRYQPVLDHWDSS